MPAVLCPSVCPSQVGVLSKWMDGSSCFGMDATFHLCYTLYRKEIRVFQKITALPFRTLSKDQGIRHSKSIVLSKRVVDDQTVDCTCDGRRAVARRSTLYTHHAL